MSKARGGGLEDLPQARGQGPQLRGSEDSDKKGEGDTVLKRQIDRNLSSDRRTQPPHLITILREG